VTPPWAQAGNKMDGKPVTFRLIVVRPDGQPVNRNTFNKESWKPALAHASLIPRERGGKRAEARHLGCHRLRHTAVSQWLHEGASVADVAEWIGDTPAQVYATYAHMMPGAEEKGRAGMAKFFSRINTGARFVPSADRSEAKLQVAPLR
jgi:integrase